MKILFGSAFLLVGVALIVGLIARHKPTSIPTSTATRNAVVVELFTSEGCSSCPPADEILARLDKTQPVRNAEVIALSEHVDYWNQLGWSDPFSSPQFSARQNAYALVLRGEGVYTPQVVVDGQVQFVGGNLNHAIDVIGRAATAPKAALQITALPAASDGSRRLRIEADRLPRLSPGDTAEVVLVITESNLQSNVANGENAGRKLSHSAVVRQLWSLGTVDVSGGRFSAEPTLTLDSAWKVDQLRAIAFLQERSSRHILGAAVISLSDPQKLSD
jgi:hypothetical protein